MQEIRYITGDAPNLSTEGNKIIVHIYNDIGGWGKGFVMAISKKWKEPEKQYREWYKSQENFEPGAAQFVQVESDLWIANVIGQHKIRKDENGNPPIRYDAVSQGLSEVSKKAIELVAFVYMPRIGCGLAGGKWEEIEPLILQTSIDSKIGTIVYDFA